MRASDEPSTIVDETQDMCHAGRPDFSLAQTQDYDHIEGGTFEATVGLYIFGGKYLGRFYQILRFSGSSGGSGGPGKDFKLEWCGNPPKI